jgi:hypothetical protein
MAERDSWWRKYDDPRAVIVGHYWRSLHRSGSLGASAGDPDPLAGIGPREGLGVSKNIHIIDYSAGFGYKVRDPKESSDEKLGPRLVALRWDGPDRHELMAVDVH